MSMDFYVWRGPSLTAEEFAQRLVDLDELDVDEASLFESSDRLSTFRRDVLARYPALEDIPDGDADSGTPWAMTPVESRHFIALNFRWSATDEQVSSVFGRALYNGLHIYDPQNGEVIAPGPERWQVWLRKVGLGRLAGPDRPW
jgi:hypothetical protein